MAIENRFFDLGSLTSATAGSAVDVGELSDIGIAVGGTFVATWSIEVSFDGSVFVPHPDFTAQTAPKSGAIGFRVKQLRVNVTAYTSGTVVGGGGGAR